MKKKVLAVAVLSLALLPCIGLFACAGNNNNETVKPANTQALNKLNIQVTGAEETYVGIYGRAERNGGLFAVSAESSASVAKYAMSKQILADNAGSDENSETALNTTALIEQLYLAVKDGKPYNFQNKAALETYVIDVFTYTQVAQEILNSEGNKSFTEIYSVDYDVTNEVYENLSTGYWSTKVPEEISFAGYDENSQKVNISFKARTPKDKENNADNFERVNSEMYYISDNDFGYAQFTYRYDSNGNSAGIGFDYFSMKEKAMLEINTDSSGNILNIFLNGVSAYPSSVTLDTIKTYFNTLEQVFTSRTNLLEQQNLALAVDAGITDVQSKNVDGETIYVKNTSATPHRVTFDYELLAKMK